MMLHDLTSCDIVSPFATRVSARERARADAHAAPMPGAGDAGVWSIELSPPRRAAELGLRVADSLTGVVPMAATALGRPPPAVAASPHLAFARVTPPFRLRAGASAGLQEGGNRRDKVSRPTAYPCKPDAQE